MFRPPKAPCRDDGDRPSRTRRPGDPALTADPQPLVDQPFDARSLGRLRAAVAAAAVKAGLTRDRVNDAVIAAHELAANAVWHGAGHGRLRQWAEGQQMHCLISDPGPADRNAASPDHQQPWIAAPGHGLWLASQAADHVTIDRHPGDGTNVTITFAVNPSE